MLRFITISCLFILLSCEDKKAEINDSPTIIYYPDKVHAFEV